MRKRANRDDGGFVDLDNDIIVFAPAFVFACLRSIRAFRIAMNPDCDDGVALVEYGQRLGDAANLIDKRNAYLAKLALLAIIDGKALKVGFASSEFDWDRRIDEEGEDRDIGDDG